MVTSDATALLAQFGLAGAELSLPERLPAPPVADVPQGRGKVAAVGFSLRELVADARTRFEPLGVTVADSAAWSIEREHRNPNVYRVTSLDPVRADVRVAADVDGDAGALQVGESVLLDATLLRTATLVLRADSSTFASPSDALLFLVADGQGLPSVQLVAPAPIAVPQLPVFASPVQVWAAAAGDDWLVQQVEARVLSGDAYEHVAAVGLCLRLVEAREEDVARRVQRLLQGAEPEAAPERAWARALSEADVQAVARLAVAHAELLASDIEVLADGAEPTESGWCAAMDGALRRRDDLEGVRLVLAERGDWHLLDAAIAELDAVGAATVMSVDWPTAPDEQLLRAAGAQPDTWWVAPAYEQHVLPGLDDEDVG